MSQDVKIRLQMKVDSSIKYFIAEGNYRWQPSFSAV